MALYVLWDDLNRFPHFFLRLGGMHLLMSFVYGSSTLLNVSGENEILGAVCWFAQWQKVSIQRASIADACGGGPASNPLL